MANTEEHAEGQQHPLGIYLKVWAWLFVLSTGSYMVDYLNFVGYLRWTLILVFMLAKAGLIVAVFMHMLWERPALLYAIVCPPILVLIFTFLMTHEAGYTFLTRDLFFAIGT